MLLSHPFPMRLKVSPAAIRELIDSEEGAYEDSVAGRSDRNPRTHVHIVAKRYRTQLCVYSEAEAVDLYYAVCSGTFQVTDEKNFLATACKIADWLRPVVAQASPETVAQWPKPTGY